MKKLLGIVVLGLLLCGNAFADVNFKKFGSLFKNPIKFPVCTFRARFPNQKRAWGE